MTGMMGDLAIKSAFVLTLLTMAGYFFGITKGRESLLKLSNGAFIAKMVLLLIASGLLLQLLITHQFQYYYVYNYTSSDLPLRYLVSAFWGGQEGSFLLWILFVDLVGIAMMVWVGRAYRYHVLFFLTLNQAFLISMITGFDFGAFEIGSSAFKSIADAFPNAPFIQANPDFVPAEGKGLNDLLRSPWMVIHPPILFLGFAMMTVPFCFALASLWKREYSTWVRHALPWTVAANLALFTAIFLGGYWAYVTLSFGGFWAWDPVENASIVPWFLGVAGIHSMLIQNKKGYAQKSALVFAILAYSAVIYEAFLTRSGILSDSSVHSFTDLGLYNQLLLFILVILGLGGVLFAVRYKDLPKKTADPGILTREFMTFSGSVVLAIIGGVIIIGTSSPILGKLFTATPTPPEISFYNNWTQPLAILAAFLTVPAQVLYWSKHSPESLAAELLKSFGISAVATLVVIYAASVTSFGDIVYLFSAFFACFGNLFVMISLLRKNPVLIGGTISHIGFGVMLIGILASTTYQQHLLDDETRAYNEAVRDGMVLDKEGFPVREEIQFVELRLGEPKMVNGKYRVSYLGMSDGDQARPGQHKYELLFEKISPRDGSVTEEFTLLPQVYPVSSAESINWSVDVDVHGGWLNDVYLYVAGSSYVEQRNREYRSGRSGGRTMANVSTRNEDRQWVLLVAEDKPFISFVWAGVFLLMGGFSVSIVRHRGRLANHSKPEDSPSELAGSSTELAQSNLHSPEDSPAS